MMVWHLAADALYDRLAPTGTLLQNPMFGEVQFCEVE